MTTSLIGQVCTSRGLIQQYDLAGDADAWTLPAVAYERAQRRVPILMQHDETWPVGEVAYYERSKVDGLLMVGTIRDDHADLLEDGDWHLSPEVASRKCGPTEYGHGTIHEVSLVRRTASVNTHPVAFARHDMPGAGGAPRGLPLRWHDTWNRAHEAIHRDRYTYRRNDALRIIDIDPLDLFDEVLCDPEVAARVAAQAAETKRRATLPTTSSPTTKRTVPLARIDGVWQSPEVSARIIEMIEWANA